MNGAEFQEIRDAIVDSFDERGFGRFLRTNFDIKLKNKVAGGAFEDVVDDVLNSFEQNGIEAHLIAKVAEERPMKAAVQRVYRKYALGVLDQAWRNQVTAAQVSALERFGLMPDVQVQLGGHVSDERPARGDGIETGFERLVNRALPAVNAYVWAWQLLKAAHRVCRIDVDSRPAGTGFLVASDLVLTNHHVVRDLIASRGDGRALTCQFDAHLGPDGKPNSETQVEAAARWADWHVDSSPALGVPAEHEGRPAPDEDSLDHAVIKLVRSIGTEPLHTGGPVRGWIEVSTLPPSLVPGMPLAILQHPWARPLKLALDTQAVRKVNENGTRVRYATNTDPGASGSPCFDGNWTLVAMHHFGDPHGNPAAYNQGIPIAAIRQRLERQGKDQLLGGKSP